MNKFRCGFCGELTSEEGICSFCEEEFKKCEDELSMDNEELLEKREREDELAVVYIN